MRSADGVALVLPMTVLSLLFFIVPLCLLVVLSFVGWPSNAAPNLSAYQTFFGEPFNRKVLIDTMLLGCKVVCTTTLLGLPIGLLYLQSGRTARQILILLTLLPMLTSNVVRTFAWIVILGREGLINTALLELGLSPQPLRLLFTELGLVMALTQIELPLLVLPLIAVVSRIDQRNMEAAATLGAGPWRILFTTILPQLIPGLLAGWILVFASAVTSFVTQSIIGGARYVYLPLFIYEQVGVLFNWQFAAAVSVILLCSTGVVLVGLTLVARHRRLVAHG